MRWFILLGACTLVSKSSQNEYEAPVQNEAHGNPYYENEAPEHYGDHQEPIREQPRPPPPQPPRREYQQDRGTGQFENRGPVDGNYIRRTTVTITNETFTLPPYYRTISTTRRTVKVNRRSYPEQIDSLIRDGSLKTPQVIEAFSKVDRGYFVHPLEDEPYGFMSRKLGRGVYLEKPHFQAKIVEILAQKLKEGGKVLDIGSGTGFMSCVFAELTGKTGKVYALEHVKEQCEESWSNIMNVRPDLIDDGRLHIRCRDGRVGLNNQAPYDVIFVSAYIPEIPYTIIHQLKPGGRLICGVGKNKLYHRLVVIDRSEDGESYNKFDLGTENFINPMVNAIDQNDNWLYQQSRRRIIDAKNQGLVGIQLARKLRLFTQKPVDLKKLEDDSYKFIEV